MQVVILSTYLMFTNLERLKKSLVILYKAGEAILLSAQNIPEAATPALGNSAGRNINQFEESISATEINLTADELAKLDALSCISLGYPHDMLNTVRG